MTDRLAARRAAQQQENSGYPTQASGNGGYQSRRPNPFAQQDYHEMSEVTTAPSGNGLKEIAEITDDIKRFNENVKRIANLQSLSLNASDAAAQKNASELENLVQETRGLSSTLKRRIERLDKTSVPQGQIPYVQNKFIEAIQGYQSVEMEHRKRYKDRIGRQYKIVKPDATPEEIQSAVDDPNGGQIFSQALLNPNAGPHYREVQARRNDVTRIERTIEELAQLFNDMSILVSQQQETIEAIETQAATVEHDTEAGLKHTNDAVKSARAARKKRWICFFIAILIVVIIAAVVGGYYASQNKK